MNNYYLQCENNYISIGSGGDGPAIRLDGELFKGMSNECETFKSPILMKNGEKHVNDMFEAKNCEVYIL